MTDEVTGLQLTLPDSWRKVSPSPVDLLLVLDDPSWPSEVFVPNAVATVAETDGTVAEVARSESLVWLNTIESARILSIEVYYVDGHEGRRVLGLYETPAGSVMTLSHYFVVNGLRTHIDVSFGAFAHETGMPVAREIVAGFVAPTTAAPVESLGDGSRTSVSDFIERFKEEQ